MATATTQTGQVGPAEERAVPSKGLWRDIVNNRIAYLYILPAFVVLLFITIYPILYQIWMSFTNYGPRNFRGSPPDFVGLNNYTRILFEPQSLPIQNYDFWRILIFDLWWTISNVFLHVVVGVAVALLLNKKGLAGKRIYRAIFVIPWAMPAFVTALMWKQMFNTQFGAINMLLDARIPWVESSAADPIP